MRKHAYKRVISIVLVISMIGTLLSGCSDKVAIDEVQTTSVTQEESVTEAIVETIANTITETIAETVHSETEPSETEEIVPKAITISTNWEDYVGDLDTLVYGFIKNEYSLYYDVFDAAITCEDGSQIFGLGYSDFSTCLTADDGTCYFPAGFISLIGESGTSELNKENLEIYNLEYDDDSTYKFLFAYGSDPYLKHCVVWDRYLQYGVDEHGVITYTAQEFDRKNCDESLGALFSYDEGRYLFDPNVGDYVYVTGVSLSEQIDYAALEEEVNQILKSQDINFSEEEVRTTAYQAQEAVTAYLLSLQEETFLGCNVDELIKYASQIDPMECIRIGEDGVILVNLADQPPSDEQQLAKWLIGAGCLTNVAGSIVLMVFFPYLAPASGAISGASMEVFMQVVKDNQYAEDINWVKVSIAATSGALMAWATPAASSAVTTGTTSALGAINSVEEAALTRALSKLAGYSVQTISNAVVSGATSAAYAIIDDKEEGEVRNAFLYGAAIGGACTIAASALTEVVGYGLVTLQSNHPENWFVELSKKTQIFIEGKQVHLQNSKLEDILTPKSVYEASNDAMMELMAQKCGGNYVLADKIMQLPSDKNKNFVKKGIDGSILKKDDLLKNGGECIIELRPDCEPELRRIFTEKGVSAIKVVNGDPQFGPLSEYQFTPSGMITSNRGTNFNNYYKDLANLWSKDPDQIPDDIKKQLFQMQISAEDINSARVAEMLSDRLLTLHEGTDGIVYLVPREVHSKLGHYGGVALAKAMAKISVGMANISGLTSTMPMHITGTLIGANHEMESNNE